MTVCDSNPFLIRDGSGGEKPSTKLWIDDIPISVADSEIEHSLTKLGCELRSNIKTERARDADHKLTRFVTGRRFVFITLPDKPLDTSVKVDIFTARLFHKEQKLVRKTAMCSNCLESGHHRSECQKDVVCRVCRKPGHRRGDKECELDTEHPHGITSQHAESDVFPSRPSPSASKTVKSGNEQGEGGGGDGGQGGGGSKERESDGEQRGEESTERAGDGGQRGEESTERGGDSGQTGEKSTERGEDSGQTGEKNLERGRKPERQLTLHNAFEVLRSDRSRSESTKRRRSGNEVKEGEHQRTAKLSKKAEGRGGGAQHQKPSPRAKKPGRSAADVSDDIHDSEGPMQKDTTGKGQNSG